MINLFLCILSSLYLCFGLFYFCCRILPRKCKISLPLLLCLSVFMALLFWFKRESQHNGITIVFQLTTFLVTLFLFQASFMKKLAVYFIFQLLIICPEILCTSVFIALHNLFIPTNTYTPHNLISSCSPAEYFVIELSNILLGLFLLWKISEILRQCIDYLKNLSEDYSLIQRQLPLLAKPGTRNLRWFMSDNFLNFWFRFIYPHQSAIELEKYGQLNEYIKSHYVQYSGWMLEKYFRERVAETMNVTQVGNYWDTKGENEIDLIALNDFEKRGVVAEVKRNPNKISYTLLAEKVARLPKEFTKYNLSQKGFSLEDMTK